MRFALVKGSMLVRSSVAVGLLAAAACADGDPRSEGDATDTARAPGGSAPAAAVVIQAGRPFEGDPRERHLSNLRQLTFDGENAEAYFSFDGARLVFQRTAPEGGCDQIYTLDLSTGDTARVSSGEGRTTCSYYYPAGDRILYASTHHHDAACPPPPDYSRGYVWAVYPTYDIFVANADGSGAAQLTDTDGYDAEATISPRGDRIVFTSRRDGDLDLYSMNLDGSDVRRLTDRVGYDGGAFFSPDGSRIVWRAHYPEPGEELDDYRALLADGLIRPSVLEIWVANADGSEARQVTDNGAANFGPYWHPSGDRIIFASNMDDPSGRDFDLYMVRDDGTGLERITWTADFDGFPIFSPDGRHLAWGSNRNPAHEGNTNVFIAEWVDDPEAGAGG
jgi:Tol biopolymer transport system component